MQTVLIAKVLPTSTIPSKHAKTFKTESIKPSKSPKKLGTPTNYAYSRSYCWDWDGKTLYLYLEFKKRKNDIQIHQLLVCNFRFVNSDTLPVECRAISWKQFEYQFYSSLETLKKTHYRHFVKTITFRQLRSSPIVLIHIGKAINYWWVYLYSYSKYRFETPAFIFVNWL